MKKISTMIMLCVCSLIINKLYAQDTIVAWSFPSASADSLVDISIPINSGAYFAGWYGTPGSLSFHRLTVDYTVNGVLGSPDKAARAVAWNGGKDSAYWIVSFKTTGYAQLQLSSAQQSGGSKPGPGDFMVQYKLSSDIAWKNLDTVLAGNDWLSGSIVNLNLPSECNDQNSNISIRWLMSSDVSSSGGTILSTGISKIDEIIVTGITISGIENVPNNNEILIYPNPNNGVFHLSIPNSKNAGKAFVYNCIGQCVKTIVLNGINSQINIDELEDGIYFIGIDISNFQTMRKIIKTQ